MDLGANSALRNSEFMGSITVCVCVCVCVGGGERSEWSGCVRKGVRGERKGEVCQISVVSNMQEMIIRSIAFTVSPIHQNAFLYNTQQL